MSDPTPTTYTEAEHHRAVALASLHFPTLTPQQRAKMVRHVAALPIQWKAGSTHEEVVDDAIELLEALSAWQTQRQRGGAAVTQ